MLLLDVLNLPPGAVAESVWADTGGKRKNRNSENRHSSFMVAGLGMFNNRAICPRS
jgi:hypothetical protein